MDYLFGTNIRYNIFYNILKFYYLTIDQRDYFYILFTLLAFFFYFLLGTMQHLIDSVIASGSCTNKGRNIGILSEVVIFYETFSLDEEKFSLNPYLL